MNDKLTVKIDKIVSGGYGFTIHNENAVFIPFVLPGETVEVEIYRRRGVYFGKILEILESSPIRKEAFCPLFGNCGGCQFQMTDYENQLQIKKEIIEESLRRIGKIEIPVNPIIASDNTIHYRNKGSFQVFGREESFIGFCYPGTTKPFAIQECPLMEHPINEKIRDFLDNPSERLKLKGMKALVIRSNGEGQTINSTIKKDSFFDRVADLDFMIDADTFFQINRTIIPKWLEYIKKLIVSHKVGKGLLDLYSGVGIIGQFLSPLFEKVVGLEVNKRLVENGNKVLERNHIQNASFIAADASRFYEYGFLYDTVIINPPRAGISPEMTATLIQAAPQVIIYSSCNPDTFSRDIKELGNGGYKIDEIQPFDMFPQTQHTEVVGVLYR
ncbi:MAG: hypothetical protein A2Y41_12030 [Spirochaetes bacterium GWB1_36_13]|nr:MAG: hypothetical protein A2Y41_12030 [Spirochaetes bacterium GWB1_36_13]